MYYSSLNESLDRTQLTITKDKQMTYDEAEEICRLYKRHLDTSCSCHMGHPPCSKCTDMPSEEEYDQALQRLERGF